VRETRVPAIHLSISAVHPVRIFEITQISGDGDSSRGSKDRASSNPIAIHPTVISISHRFFINSLKMRGGTD
jgi:hypothetical protein